MKCFIKLLRIRHWIKNLLLFFPLIFYKSKNADDYLCVLSGCLAFSLMASAIYIVNDIRDVEKDRMHEVKRSRPIASGEVSIPKAVMVAILCVLIAIGINCITSKTIVSLFILGIYFLINILYSFGLKNVPILDVLVLALGFILRVLMGGALVSIKVSPILMLTVMMLALYMGLGKRRNEKRKIKEGARRVLRYYTDDFLNKNMYFCLTLGVIFYSMWVLSLEERFVYTVIGVIVICMRYNLTIDNDSLGDPVDVLLGDKVLLGMVSIFAIWIIVLLFH